MSMPRAGICQLLRRTAITSRSAHQVTWRANSTYPGRQGNRAGERYMRLRLFDRIRRLAQSRRPPAETVPAVSGSSRQASPRPPRARHGAGFAQLPGRPGLSRWPGSGARPGARGRRPVRAWRPARRADAYRRTLARRVTGSGSAVRGGPRGETWRSGRIAARATGAPAPAGRRVRPRCAPGRPGRGSAKRPRRPRRPVSAAPGPQARWQETAEPGLAQATAQAAARTDAQAAELARVAAGVPRQPDGLGRSA